MRHTKLATYSDHDLATTIWAVANMTCPKTPKSGSGRIFVEELVDAVCKQPKFAPQGLSMTLWSCATLAAQMDIPNDKVLAALLPQVIAAADNFNPQGASNILWALATMDAHARTKITTDSAQDLEPQICWDLQALHFETCDNTHHVGRNVCYKIRFESMNWVVVSNSFIFIPIWVNDPV